MSIKPPTACACGKKAVCLAVTYSDINRAKKERREIDERIERDHPRSEGGLQVIPGSALFMPDGSLPFIAPWKPKCGECADAVMAYYVDYDRLRNERDALDWTLHLQGKNWFEVTDWRDLMYRFLGAGAA